MKIFNPAKFLNQTMPEKPLVITEADFLFNEVRVPWDDVTEYRARTSGAGGLEIVTKDGRSVCVPRSVKIYYGDFPIALGPDPCPFLLQRIREKCPGARMVPVSDREMIVLLTVLNAEIIGVIFALFAHKNVALAMLIAAAVGVPAAFLAARPGVLRVFRPPGRK